MSIDAGKLAHARQVILTAARDMKAGKLSFIEGARTISGHRFAAKLEVDPDILPFVAMDSETDALPMGEIRVLWDPAALASLQPTIDQSEAWAHDIGIAFCENIIRRLSEQCP